MYKKGFTLIELLVVIAIIGILSSVVLASLNTARNKGKDATVQAQLSSARAQAEIYNATNGNYLGVCAALQTATHPGILTLLNASAKGNALGDLGAVVTLVTTAGAFDKVTCHDTSVAWAAEAPMMGSVSAAAKMWCVDSTGASKLETAVMLASATACL